MAQFKRTYQDRNPTQPPNTLRHCKPGQKLINTQTNEVVTVDYQDEGGIVLKGKHGRFNPTFFKLK